MFALRKARTYLGLEPDKVDELCRLGSYYRKPVNVLPSQLRKLPPLPENAPGLVQVEDDPTSLSSRSFTILSSLLQIRLDKEFNQELSELWREEVLRFKRELVKARGEATYVPNGECNIDERIDEESEGRLLILLRALEEMDAVDQIA